MPHKPLQILSSQAKSLSAKPLAVVIAIAFTSIGSPAYADTNIVWSDEFNGVSLDTNKWTYDTDSGIWVPNPG